MKLLPVLVLAAALPMLAPAAERPNIIVIMVDDMGFSDIGPYGSEIPTPHLDRLAANGACFSQFYNTGRCCPTRASLLTGLYSHQAGIGHMTADQKLPGYRGRLSERCVTIAEVLGSNGYRTSMTGKWHVGHDEDVNPPKRGFHRSLNLALGGVHFSDQSGQMQSRKLYLDGVEIAKDDPRLSPPWYGSDLWTDWTIKFIDEAIAEEKPFFHYLAHFAPHFPCMAPETTIAQYRGQFMKGWDALREERHQRQVDSGLIDASWTLTPRPDAVPAWGSLPASEQKRYDDMMAIYAAMIDEVDKNIGKLVEALKARGQLDNTLILFLADNGGNAEAGVRGRHEGEQPGDPHSHVFIGQCWAHLNNTPFRKYKHYNHEGGTSSPLIAHWPAAIKPRDGWITTPAHVVDLMSTCVDLAGATYPEEFRGNAIHPMDGVSLKPLMTGSGALGKRPIFWEHEGNAAVRIGDRKLVRAGTSGPWELFDMKADRTEQHDLAASHPEEVATLEARWTRWARSHQVLPKPGAKKKPAKSKGRQPTR